jgi:hypothetical protein
MHILAQSLSILQAVKPEPRLRCLLENFSLAEHYPAAYRSHPLQPRLSLTVYRKPGTFVCLKVAL